MASRAEDVGDPLGDLSYLTEQRTRALQDVRVLTAEQVRLTAASEAAVAEAAAATVKIQSDRYALTKVVAAQRELVGELRALQIDEVEKADPDAGRNGYPAQQLKAGIFVVLLLHAVRNCDLALALVRILQYFHPLFRFSPDHAHPSFLGPGLRQKANRHPG